MKKYSTYPLTPLSQSEAVEQIAYLTGLHAEQERLVGELLKAVDYLLDVREIKCLHKGEDGTKICANCLVRAAAAALRAGKEKP